MCGWGRYEELSGAFYEGGYLGGLRHGMVGFCIFSCVFTRVHRLICLFVSFIFHFSFFIFYFSFFIFHFRSFRGCCATRPSTLPYGGSARIVRRRRRIRVALISC